MPSPEGYARHDLAFADEADAERLAEVLARRGWR
jgi:hypothetical protein